MRSLRWIAVLMAALTPQMSLANVPTLNNITLGDYDKVVREFSANFAYSSITPASSLGIFGFELGLVGGITKTPEILALVRRSSPNYSEDKLPHAAILGRVGIPYGLNLEAMILPEMKISDVSFYSYAGALSWTMTDIVLQESPVTVMFKGFYNKANINYAQSLQNSTTGNQPVDATIDYDNDIYGIQALISRKFFLFEPYVGLGYVKSIGELAVRAALAPNATIFAGTGIGASAKSKPNSAQLLVGSDFRISFFTLGA
jgi:hypothetical protein